MPREHGTSQAADWVSLVRDANRLTLCAMPHMSRGPALFAGIGTGVLLGLLLGLSASPVVSVVVGGLVTAAAAYWNLSAPAEDASRSYAVRALAAGMLCVGCIAGMLGGLWLRARDVFAVSPAQHVATWAAAGYSPAEARTLAAYQATGVLLGSGTMTSGASGALAATPATAAERTAHSTLLFSSASVACDQLRPDDYADAANLRAAFTQAGGRWRAMADAASGVDATRQMTLLRTAWQLACER
jgi:hypothetical protein